MQMTPTRALAVLGLLAALGCGGASPPPSAARTQAHDVLSADTVLQQGGWRLVTFRPEVAPDPMYAAILSSQVGQLVVHFEQGQLHADSPTLHLVRAYRVVDAAGPSFRVESPDTGGGVLVTSAQLAEDGRHIAFHADTDPFRGYGTLEHVP